jgi:hypothetical protein
MKKLIVIVGVTYFVTHRWDSMTQGDRNKIKAQAKELAYKAAQVIGRELEELGYRVA